MMHNYLKIERSTLYHHETGAAARIDPRRADPVTRTLLHAVTETSRRQLRYNEARAEIGGPQEFLGPEAFEAYMRNYNAMG